MRCDKTMLSADRMVEACKKLWQAVLKQAIKDARWDVTARLWFCSKDQGTGSFLWICSLLGISPESIRRLVGKKYDDEAIFARWFKTTTQLD